MVVPQKQQTNWWEPRFAITVHPLRVLCTSLQQQTGTTAKAGMVFRHSTGNCIYTEHQEKQVWPTLKKQSDHHYPQSVVPQQSHSNWSHQLSQLILFVKLNPLAWIASFQPLLLPTAAEFPAEPVHLAEHRPVTVHYCPVHVSLLTTQLSHILLTSCQYWQRRWMPKNCIGLTHNQNPWRCRKAPHRAPLKPHRAELCPAGCTRRVPGK